MNSQVVVNIDTELKQKAMKMAKKEGLTMKALLSFLLKGYVEDEIFLGAKIRREYDVEDIKVNKQLQEKMNNLSDLL